MATAKKLPSGNWHIQLYDYKDENGKIHMREFTADTKAEVEYLAAEWRKNRANTKRAEKGLTVRDCCERYIQLKALLSPSTLYGYKKAMRNTFQRLMDMRVDKLTDEIVQIEINKESLRVSEETGKQVSAKYVHNAWGFISSAIYTVGKRKFDVTLPRKPRRVHEYPEPQAVLDAIIGSDVELPCLLAFWLSFTMSEIRGLRCSDIKNGTITLNRVVVDVDGKPFVKDCGKTDGRLRMHRLPKHIISLIEKQQNYIEYKETGKDSWLIQMYHHTIYKKFKKLIQPIDPQLSFHGLRHMSVSVMALLSIPIPYAMERGGYMDSSIMMKTYTHTFSKERIAVDNVIDSYFDDMIEKQKATAGR